MWTFCFCAGKAPQLSEGSEHGIARLRLLKRSLIDHSGFVLL
jgi:hypothetical protein